MSTITKGFNLNLTPGMRMPSIEYINEMASEKQVSFKNTFTKAPPLLEDLLYIYTREREEQDDFDVKKHLLAASTIELDRMEALNEAEVAYYTETLKFLLGLSYEICPGYTPMDKALNTIMYMSKLSTKNNNGRDDIWDDDYYFKEILIGPEDLSAYIREFMNGIGVPGSVVNDKLSVDIISCIRDFYSDLNPIISSIYSNTVMESIPINRRILSLIGVKSYLEDKLGLQTGKSTKMIDTNRSNQSRTRVMNSYDELSKVSKMATILPNFDDKFVKKELGVRRKVTPETRKQIVVELHDDSGSMATIIKQSYVRAMTLNRLEAVAKGDAELEFWYYGSDRYGNQHISDLDGCRSLMKEVTLRVPNQGGTNIGLVLQSTINDVCDNPKYVNPEIVIVCDGDDHVNADLVDPKGVKINVVILGCRNKGLKAIAAKSGGFYQIEELYDRY